MPLPRALCFRCTPLCTFITMGKIRPLPHLTLENIHHHIYLERICEEVPEPLAHGGGAIALVAAALVAKGR